MRLGLVSMTSTSEERDTRIPYRLGTDHYCTYENEGEESYVRMGDMISHVYDTPFGEFEIDGELCSVRYGEGGFIDTISVYVSGKEMNYDVPCEGVFYRMESEHV
ncbi:hypothetical protein SAMN04489857_0666 [Parafannyhessea umbonata]|uniref:Uncharacterized protein n=2 Tax=Parafannyhessea umbonata TaxID=604330 RepID=A0A1H1L3C1_9ACTN|nr:hypothetical protein SAMN04489857_0666 [Parafannyhessea umbonata]